MSTSGVVCVSTNTTAAILTQLAAKGAQDVLLTCDPKCSLFHQSYCRITNFGMGEQTLSFQSAPSGQNFTAATSLRAEVLRAGDLLGAVYLDGCLAGLPQPIVSSPNTSVDALLWTPAVSYALISQARVVIGSQEFERQEGEYMMMHDEISRTEGCRASRLIGDYGMYFRGCAVAGFEQSVLGSDQATIAAGIEFSTRSQKILAPLPLFWTKHSGNFLNVVGSQYHNIVIELDTRASSQLILALNLDSATGGVGYLASNLLVPGGAGVVGTAGTNHGVLSGLSILAHYVQLDTAERRLKAQAAQTIRMVYVQNATYSTVETDAGSTKEVSNFFNHPITRMAWAWRNDDATQAFQWFRFGAFRGNKYQLVSGYYPKQEVVPSFNEFELLINNHSRTHQAAEYYLYVQPYQHAKRVPSRLVYSYSFAMYPEADDMHSGSINLSRIDNVVLRWTFKSKAPAADNTLLAGNANLAAHNQVADLVSDQTNPAVIGATVKGTMFLYAETINFYKQAAGMFGLLFAN